MEIYPYIYSSDKDKCSVQTRLPDHRDFSYRKLISALIKTYFLEIFPISFFILLRKQRNNKKISCDAKRP